MNNLAAKDPQRVASMFASWKAWADKTGVFPMDTREYGERQRAYKRVINGQFDDNFGDWGVAAGKDSGVSFSIDDGSVLSGIKSARADIAGAGGRPLNAALKWIFPVDEKCSAYVSFQGKSSGQTTVRVRLESLDKPGEKMFEKDVVLGTGPSQHDLGSYTLPGKGRYQLIFLFGASEKSTCWIDDVVLKFD
jgi:arylsulfatase